MQLNHMKCMYLSLCFITMPPPWFGWSNEVIAVTLRWFLNVADSIDSAPKKLWPVDVRRIIGTAFVGSPSIRTIYLRHWSNRLKPSTRTLSSCQIHLVDIPVFLYSVILCWMARVPHAAAEGFPTWKIQNSEQHFLLIDVWCSRYRIGYEDRRVRASAGYCHSRAAADSFVHSRFSHFSFLVRSLANAKKNCVLKTPFWNSIRILCSGTVNCEGF